jgi:hypothetical protein
MPNFEERVYSLLDRIVDQDKRPQGIGTESNPRLINGNGQYHGLSRGQGLVGGDGADFYGNVSDPRANFGLQYGNGLMYKKARGAGLIDYNLKRPGIVKNARLNGGQGMDSHNLGDLRPRLTDYYIRNYDELGGGVSAGMSSGGAGIVEGDERFVNPGYPRSLRRGGKVQMKQYEKVMDMYNHLESCVGQMGEHSARDLLESEPYQMFDQKFGEFDNMIENGHKGKHMTEMGNQLLRLGQKLCKSANQGAGLVSPSTMNNPYVKLVTGRGRSGGSTSVISSGMGTSSGGNIYIDPDRDVMLCDKQYGNYQGCGDFDYGNNGAFSNNQRYMDAMMRESLDYNRAFIPIRPKEQTYLEHNVRQKAKNIMVDNELYYKPPVTQEILRRVKEREAFLKNMQDQAQQNVKYNVPYPREMLNKYAKTVNVETGMGRRRKNGGSYTGPKGMGRSGGGGTGGARRANPWISHLKAYRKAHPGESLKQAMSGAKASYKK